MLPPIEKRYGPSVVTRLLGMLIGAILARSAFAHLSNPYAFLDAVVAYQLIQGVPSIIAAILLPCLQLTLAFALIVGWWIREAFALTLLLFVGFMGVQISAIARGLDVTCGCFGTAASVKVGWQTFGLCSACAITAAVGCYLFRSRSSPA